MASLGIDAATKGGERTAGGGTPDIRDEAALVGMIDRLGRAGDFAAARAAAAPLLARPPEALAERTAAIAASALLFAGETACAVAFRRRRAACRWGTVAPQPRITTPALILDPGTKSLGGHYCHTTRFHAAALARLGLTTTVLRWWQDPARRYFPEAAEVDHFTCDPFFNDDWIVDAAAAERMNAYFAAELATIDPDAARIVVLFSVPRNGCGASTRGRPSPCSDCSRRIISRRATGSTPLPRRPTAAPSISSARSAASR
jgi:hypothetical protein